MTPPSIDLIGAEVGDQEDEESASDDEITRARPGPSRAALDLGDGVVAEGEPIRPPSARREAVTIPMHAAVARLETAPVLSPSVAAAGPPLEPLPPAPAPPAPAPSPRADSVPEPIEPVKTESVRRPARWGAPVWLPAFALVCAGVFGIAALLYWLLDL